MLDHMKEHKKTDTEMEIKNQMENADAEIDRLIPNYVDMQCELCQYAFDTLSEARSHYRSKHKRHTHLVKCCQLRLKIHGEIRDHIKFHLNPNQFKCVFITCSIKSNPNSFISPFSLDAVNVVRPIIRDTSSTPMFVVTCQGI